MRAARPLMDAMRLKTVLLFTDSHAAVEEALRLGGGSYSCYESNPPIVCSSFAIHFVSFLFTKTSQLLAHMMPSISYHLTLFCPCVSLIQLCEGMAGRVRRNLVAIYSKEAVAGGGGGLGESFSIR